MQPVKKEQKEPAFEGIRKFFRNVMAELRKVNWPSKKELQTYTIVVIATVLVVSLIISTWDLLIAEVFKAAGLYR
ncbi:MAG TPA: preprotein translocase subunit SecE [Bacillota bacterium]|nr:preprotein translocase subunit SecE [Bacillota bacterium]